MHGGCVLPSGVQVDSGQLRSATCGTLEIQDTTMKTVTFNSNWGRFNYEITAQVSDTLTAPELATVKQGLANCGFRAVGSSVDKALVKAKAMHKDDTRKVVVYNADNVGIITTAAKAKLSEIIEKDGLLPMTYKVTGEHVFDDAATPMVRATALVDSLLGTEGEAQMRGFLSIMDARAAKANREILIEIAHKAGAGIQPPKSK